MAEMWRTQGLQHETYQYWPTYLFKKKKKTNAALIIIKKKSVKNNREK